MAEDNNIEEQKVENAEEQTVEATAETAETAASETAETTDSEAEETATAEPVDERDVKIAELEAQVAAQKDQYLRLYAEFDNYKKRTLKEKAELIQTAGKNVLEQMLPLIDDVERAMVSVQGVKEGIDLIYNKFVKFLDSNNVKEIETVGLPFNTDFHEAVAQVPMGEDKKGVVIDCTQKGYIMGEKVVRFAKVVIGA